MAMQQYCLTLSRLESYMYTCVRLRNKKVRISTRRRSKRDAADGRGGGGAESSRGRRRRGVVVRIGVRGRRTGGHAYSRWRVAVLPGPVVCAPPVKLVARWSNIATAGRVGRRVRPRRAVGRPRVVLDVCQGGAACGVGDEDAGEEGLGRGREPRGVVEVGCCNGIQRQWRRLGQGERRNDVETQGEGRKGATAAYHS